jgi:hypothetical protein
MHMVNCFLEIRRGITQTGAAERRGFKVVGTIVVKKTSDVYYRARFNISVHISQA